MKRMFVSAITLSAALVSLPVLAQQNPNGAAGGALSGAATGAVGGAIVGGPVGAAVGAAVGATAGAVVGGSVTPQQRVYVRQYAVKQRVEPIRVDERIVVGQPLPRTVRYYPIQGDPSLSNYNYTYVNDQYYLVDADGRVVEVLAE